MFNKYVIEDVMCILWLYTLTLKDENKKNKKKKEQTTDKSRLIIEVNGNIKRYNSYEAFTKDLPEYNTIKLFIKGSSEAEKVKELLKMYYKTDYKIIKMDL